MVKWLPTIEILTDGTGHKGASKFYNEYKETRGETKTIKKVTIEHATTDGLVSENVLVRVNIKYGLLKRNKKILFKKDPDRFISREISDIRKIENAVVEKHHDFWKEVHRRRMEDRESKYKERLDSKDQKISELEEELEAERQDDEETKKLKNKIAKLQKALKKERQNNTEIEQLENKITELQEEVREERSNNLEDLEETADLPNLDTDDI